MSDISIPGVNSKYNTDKMIEGLMEVEKIPLNRLEDQKETYQDQKKIWQDMNVTLSRFRDSSRALFGFQNPFQEHIADSSNESVVTAIAGREADNEVFRIKVSQLASSDRFMSSSLPKDFRVPAGTYGFQVGEEEIKFDFRENRIQAFTEALERRSNGLLKTRLINDTSDTIVLLVESAETGSSNRLTFKDDSVDLGISTGLIKPVYQEEHRIDLSPEGSLAAGNSSDSVSFRAEANSAVVEPGGKLDIPFTPAADMNRNLILEYDVKIENLDREEYKPPPKPAGPEITSPGSVSFEGITINNSPSRINLPEWTPPEPPPYKDNLNVLTLNGSTPLPSLKNSEEIQHFSIPYSTTGDVVSSITVNNDNTHRKIEISGIRITNPEARDGYEPVNPASTALDAKLSLDGIPVTRESNTIEDLVPGVTLNLLNTDDREVEIEIKPDSESIKNGIISFVGNYNQVMQKIHILTSNDDVVIDELDYLTDEEKAEARDNLGIFQGDTSFTQLKNRMQRIAMEPYITSAGSDMTLLSQIGISTNSSGFGGGVNKAKLRGYLEINEDALDEALTQNIPAIKELFGRDSDGDLIVDSGAAFEMDRFVNSYTQIGGLVATRIAGLDTRISQTDTDILNMKNQLEDKELELKIKFGRMESALKTMEDNSNTLDNFNNSNK